MADTIRAPQTGRQLDRDLRAIYQAETTDNDGLILYIRHGELAFDTEENLFTVTPLTQED